jgi:spermidine synthase
MKPDAEASLHIGLGIGMTAKAFAEHGLRTDVIELHPEVGHRPSF